MHHNKDTTENREMKNTSTALHAIHFAGMQEGCTSKLHPTEQQREQMILHGYYRSRIPDFCPLKGEAG